MKPSQGSPSLPASVVRSWFQLTPSEQKAVLLLVSLFLLGLAVRTWHYRRAAGVETVTPAAGSVSTNRP